MNHFEDEALSNGQKRHRTSICPHFPVDKRKAMSCLLIALLCCAIICPAQSAPADKLRRFIERLQAAITAHQNQIASQKIVVHFKDDVMDIKTESREIVSGGSVVTTSQILRTGTVPRLFHNLPTTVVDPLHCLPNQFDQQRQKETGDSDSSMSIEGVGKTVFRLLPTETFEGTTYDVAEFVQDLPRVDRTELDPQALVCTKIVCKLYIGSNGLIQRKTGVICYQATETKPATGKTAKKAREQRATFESTRIEYRDPPVEAPRPKVS